MVIKYNKLYQPDQKFNNKINWEVFRTLKSWKDVIDHFRNRVKDFFFSPINLLYDCTFPGRITFVHNFPISNICWSLLDLLTQLESGSRVEGIDVDNFLLSNQKYFKNINAASAIASSFQKKGSKNPHTVYDIFRNKPFHNAMVKGLGSLDHLAHDVFTISNKKIIIDGATSTIDTIIENPIKLFKAIKKYFKRYISNLRKSLDLQNNFKNWMEKLFEFKFQYIK